MNFRDTWAEDEQGKRFVFTVEMKRKLTKAGLPIELESLKQLGETLSVAELPTSSMAVRVTV